MTEPRAKIFGRRLKNERGRLGLTQTEFAGRLGVGSSRQSLLESGNRDLGARYLQNAASAGVDPLFILTGRRGALLPTGDSERVISAYLSLPKHLQEAVLDFTRSLGDALGRHEQSKALGAKNSADEPPGVTVDGTAKTARKPA